MAIKKMKLPGMNAAVDIGVDWKNISNIPTLLTSEELESAINEKMASSDAIIYKGTIGNEGTVQDLPAVHSIGWMYKVITPETYAGSSCEVGDMIICIANGTVTNNADWSIIQANINTSSLAPLASPSFTGTPLAPTASVGTNNTQVATTAFVQAALSNVTPNIEIVKLI